MVTPGPDDRETLSAFDYAREQVLALRKDIMEKFDHESRYRKQYGEMAADTYQALSEKGWVTIALASMAGELAEMKEQQKEDRIESKRAQTRILTIASALLVSTLTLLITIVFGILTK